MTHNPCIRWIAALALSASGFTAFAHGDEPHGDAPHPVAAAQAGSPHFEAATDLFELVARLEGGALTVFINRFETNEPVLQAQVELETGPLKALAFYRGDLGSYEVRNPAFLKALGQPGTHPVVVTVTAGDEADLLEGRLQVAARHDVASSAPRLPVGTALAGVLGASALGAGAIVVRRRRANPGAAR